MEFNNEGAAQSPNNLQSKTMNLVSFFRSGPSGLGLLYETQKKQILNFEVYQNHQKLMNTMIIGYANQIIVHQLTTASQDQLNDILLQVNIHCSTAHTNDGH
jgi:hypothetical protein